MRIHEFIQAKYVFGGRSFVANSAVALFFVEKSVEIVDNFMQLVAVEKLSDHQTAPLLNPFQR